MVDFFTWYTTAISPEVLLICKWVINPAGLQVPEEDVGRHHVEVGAHQDPGDL